MSNSEKKKKLIAKVIESAKAGEGDLQQLQEANEVTAAESLLNDHIVIGGIKMRSFRLSTVAMLKQINSPLIFGVPVESIPNVVVEVMKLFVLQTVSLDEAIALSKDPAKLETEAFKFSDRISINKTESIVTETLEAFRKSIETQVVPVPDKTTKTVTTEGKG